MAFNALKLFVCILSFIFTINPVYLSVFSNLPGLDRFCDLKNGSIHCNINVVNYLNFQDVRKLLADVSDSADVILNITCAYVGHLQLPWPMKSRNIKELYVDGCHIHGFYSYIDTKMLSTPDTMIKLRVENSIMEASVFDALKIFSKEVSRSFKCGQLTLHSLLMRNTSYQFVLEPADVSNLEKEGILIDAEDVAVTDENPAKYHCQYKDLEVIDISKSMDGMTYFILPFEHSEYPKLTVFNMSGSGLVSFPDLFLTWEDVFPNIEYIDLSENDIDSFNFIAGNSTAVERPNPLFVNLRNNQFMSIPKLITTLLDRPTSIIVDLSENPLKCDCDSLLYKDFIIRALSRYQNIDSLKDARCIELRGGKTRILDLELSTCQTV